MKRLASQGAWLPLLALGAGACGANNTPSGDDHFVFTMLADFEESEWFNKNDLWEGRFLNTVDPSELPTDYAMTFERKAPSPSRTNPDGSVSTMALHASEEGFHTLWGTAIYADFKNSHAVDLGRFTGFSIWARSAGMPGATVKVGFADYGSFNQVGDLPQLCNPNDNVDGKGCYDDYSAKIYPDGAWRRYDIAFSSLTTGGWGYPHAFDQTRVYRIKFSMLPTTRYDLWFDDAAFYVDGY